MFNNFYIVAIKIIFVYNRNNQKIMRRGIFMSTTLKCNKKLVEHECKILIEKCKKAINKERNFIHAYDYAVQAKYLAENILQDEMHIIECERLRGVSYLELDQAIGHRILYELYYNNKSVIEKEPELELRVKISLGTAYRFMGDYENAISILCEAIELCQKKIETAKKTGNEAAIISYIRGIIICSYRITVALLYQNRQKHYPCAVKRLEARIKEMKTNDIEELKKEFEDVQFSSAVNNELIEAKRYITDALRMCEEFQQNELELVCWVNYACVLIDQENYHEALKILEKAQTEEYITQNYNGHVLNEIGICQIELGKLESGMDYLNKAWNWLSQKKNFHELARNLYGTALYHYKTGNLEMSYAYADLAFSQDQDICSLKLLYEVSFLKFVQTQRHGNESEYAFYRHKYETYREKLERRS